MMVEAGFGVGYSNRRLAVQVLAPALPFQVSEGGCCISEAASPEWSSWGSDTERLYPPPSPALELLFSVPGSEIPPKTAS